MTQYQGPRSQMVWKDFFGLHLYLAGRCCEHPKVSGVPRNANPGRAISWLAEMESRTQGSRPRTQKKNPRPRKALPRTDPLEAKDTRRKCSPKKTLQKFFFRRSPKKEVFETIFQAFYKILTIQKIVLSSSKGQGNFRGLEALRPRTSKCVFVDSTSDG